jgi:phage-related protein
VQIGDALWVVHAFQKKSTRGIKTPKRQSPRPEGRGLEGEILSSLG